MQSFMRIEHRPIYLDYAATTPVDPRVAEVMAQCLTRDGVFGNPASIHAHGRAAAAVVEQARVQVAALIGAQPEEIIFTSGATESNNLALQGVARFQRRGGGRHIVTLKTEHKSVVDACRQLELDGWRVTWLKPAADGLLDPAALEAALRPETVLVAVMHANNETGVVQDIAAIGRITRARGITLLVDATQSVGKLPLHLAELDVDLLSCSAHKFYGPKGIGALYVRRQPRARLAPLMFGGGHERGLRPGTLATHQIAGFGEACRLAEMEMAAEQARIAPLRDRLWQELARLPEVWRNGHTRQCLAGILNISFGGVDGEALLADLDGLCVSSGSACTSASAEPSYVLRALGRSDELASLRFSLGRWTTSAELDAAVAQVTATVERLRALSPLWPTAELPAARRA
jgi:cysteine desulfurase